MKTVELKILEDMMRRWTAGDPVCLNPHKQDAGRYAPRIYSAKHQMPAFEVERLMRFWIGAGIVVKGTTHKKYGLRPSRDVLYAAQERSAEVKNDTNQTSANLRQINTVNNLSY